MTSVAPYPPPGYYDNCPQPMQRPSGGSYDYPPPYGQKPSGGGFDQYPPEASYPPGYYGYPPPPPPPPPQQQQQQQSIVIVNSSSVRETMWVSTMSFGTHKCIACIAFWLCGVVFGAIAFILAVFAESSADVGDYSTARCFGHASMSISLIGMVVFIIILSASLGA